MPDAVPSRGEDRPDVIDVDWFTGWMHRFADQVDTHVRHLTDLDAAIGDADHGTNLQRGMTAVRAGLPQAPADLAGRVKFVGMTLVSSVGGASGPLYGTFFLRLAGAVGDRTTLTATQFGEGLRAGVDGVTARGKAVAGDKTMLDAWLPAVDAYAATADAGFAAAISQAAAAAARGRDATAPLVARKGRASYLGERSVGHLDPGAASTALLLAAAAEAG